MSWRWRKSFGRGPVRISMSKKGVGWSVGIPGLRYGRSPDGRRYVSQGFPGTGLYRIRYFPTGKKAAPLGAPPPPVPTTPPGAPTPMQRNLPTARPTPTPAAPGTVGPGPLARVTSAITRFFDRLF